MRFTNLQIAAKLIFHLWQSKEHIFNLEIIKERSPDEPDETCMASPVPICVVHH
jgi:hypothetical protein